MYPVSLKAFSIIDLDIKSNSDKRGGSYFLMLIGILVAQKPTKLSYKYFGGLDLTYLNLFIRSHVNLLFQLCKFEV